MSDWKARIDALPPLPIGEVIFTPNKRHADLLVDCLARMSTAVERMKEPHSYNCRVGYDVNLNRMIPCECGRDADVLRILGGK